VSASKGVQVTVRTNALEVAKNIEKGTEEIMKMLPNALKEYVVEVCKELLNKSYPAPGNDPEAGGGNSDEAMKQGVDNLTAEINSAFTTWDKTMVGDLIMAKNEEVLWNLNNPIPWRSPRLQKAWDSKDINYLYETFARKGWTEPSEVVNYQSDASDALHNKLRDPKSGAVLDAVKNNKNLRISVRDRQVIESYILTRQKSIGTMAGGWVKALTALGAPVSSQFGGNGYGGATIKTGGLSIHAYNSLGDYNKMISSLGIIEDTVRDKGEDLKKTIDDEIARILKANSTKSGGKP
jgi:hypothetical protein